MLSRGCQDKMNKIRKYIKESLAGAGASMDGMSAPFSAVGQEIDVKRKKKAIPLGKTMGSYVDEDAPANAAGGGNVAALGVGPQGEPGRKAVMQKMARRGRFMTYETFIVSSATFNSLREAKKHGKHWRTYLNEDDAYQDLREYAKKCNGPIIVEDERTGACMYVRYGKKGLHEAWTNTVGRGGSRWLSDAGNNIRDLEDWDGAKKIGNYDKQHSVYTHSDYNDDGPTRHYHLVHNETGHITHSVNGPMKKGVLKVSGAGASEENKKLGTKIKMEDFYHHLLKKGARHEASGSKEPNRHPVALVGTSHSGPSEDEEGDYGAQKVWRNLAKKRGTTVHGFVGGKKGKAINIGKAEDPTETHADPHDYSDLTGEPNKGSDREATEVGKMKLVASVEVPKKKKFRYKIRRRGR